MTQPRMCFPGTTYMVTRTVHNRQFLTAPSPVVNGVMLYCMFRAAGPLGIEIHAASVQANHVHLVLTDWKGNLSAFMQRFCRLAACCLIEYYRELNPSLPLDGIWSKTPFNATALLNQNAVVDKVLYALTNPVKDGMVNDYRKWPGMRCRLDDWARSIRYAERPDHFFDQTDEVHASVPYRFTVPPMLADLPLEKVLEDLGLLLRERQADLRGAVAAEGRRFKGEKAVLAINPFDGPSGTRPKGGTNPTVAAGGDVKLLQRGIALVRAFRQAYREAWCAYIRGAEVVFPAGTLMMRLRHRVRCDEQSLPWCAGASAPG